MSEHFIKNIEIKNFKCFEDFKAEGFGRVNLIGGKNNVGKSTLLEALYINLNADNQNWFLNSIFDIVRKRDNFFLSNITETTYKFFKTAFSYKSTLIKEYENGYHNSINTNLNRTEFRFLEKFSGTTISYNINNESDKENILFSDFKDLFKSDTILYTNNKIHFLRPIGLSNYKIINFYSNIQRINKENQLNSWLNKFDKTITKFKIIDSEPQIFQNNKYISVTQLGDGAKKLINIFISIYSSQKGVILIDEIDNGIHYSYLDKLWEIILTISKQQNVQVFATTHSKECIESYARVAKKLEDEEIIFIELGKNKEDEIKAMVYPYDWFIDEVEQNHEVRGW